MENTYQGKVLLYVEEVALSLVLKLRLSLTPAEGTAIMCMVFGDEGRW